MFFKYCLPFADIARQRWYVNGVSTFIARFKHNFKAHGFPPEDTLRSNTVPISKAIGAIKPKSKCTWLNISRKGKRLISSLEIKQMREVTSRRAIALS